MAPISLEPFTEVQRALLVVEVLELPGPQLGSLLSASDGREHYLSIERNSENL